MWWLLLTACAVEPVPGDFDGLVRWFWVEYEPADDAALNQGLQTLHTLVDGDTRQEPLLGELTALTAADIAHVEVPEGTDPASTRGMVMVNPVACTLAQLEPVLYHLEQDALYEGVYSDYARTYTLPLADFTSGASPFIAWEATMGAALLGTAYTETIHGGLRRVEGGERGLLLARAHMPTPAVWEDPDWSFPQDYQIELYWERAPGELLHLYGIWRYMDLGGLTTDNDGVVITTLNNLVDWDARTAELCAEGI